MRKLLPTTPADIDRSAQARSVYFSPWVLTNEKRRGATCRRVPTMDGVVVFACGDGSTLPSLPDRRVAQSLQERGFRTLRFDPLTPEEAADRDKASDIQLLSRRLLETIDAVRPEGMNMPLGLFGTHTGAASALVAAALRPSHVRAVVSCGGRPDMARESLERVLAPTLLIVGEADTWVLDLNRQALRRLRCECWLYVVPGATHLFEEAGALEEAALLAGDWFAAKLGGS